MQFRLLFISLVFEVSLNKLYLVSLCNIYMDYVIYTITNIINLRT